MIGWSMGKGGDNCTRRPTVVLWVGAFKRFVVHHATRCFLWDSKRVDWHYGEVRGNTLIIRRRTTAAELSEELRQFEAEFGVPSERMTEAFTEGGELRETPAFARWSLVYRAYQMVSGVRTPA